MTVIQKNHRLWKTNIPSMFISTSLAMIITELTGVITVLIDGIITSRFLSTDVYAGISLVKPFTSIVLMFAGFISTGCMVVCSRLIGVGKKDDANAVFSLSLAAAVFFAGLLFILSALFPDIVLRLCGVSLTKYPELNVHMYGYLTGYMIGVPAMILNQIIGPVIVMDNGKKLFSQSSFVLCAVDIIGDLLVAFVWKAGAFGMGLATSAGYIIQLLILLLHFVKPGHYFSISRNFMRFSQLKDMITSGTPALVKKFSGTLRDVLINYLNIQVALTAAAISAKGIQSDLFSFLFCIPTGLGRTLITMAGIYYGSHDLKGLKRLYTTSFQFGFILSAAAGILAFSFASLIPEIYTNNPEVISLAAFSIRWMSVGLVLDTMIVIIQHYLQGIGNLKTANLLSFSERLIVPVICAFVLGMLFGTKGILASTAVAKMVLFLMIVIIVCIRCKGLPKHFTDIMFLPEEFGGGDENNMYAEINTIDDVIRQSVRTEQFCLDHGASKHSSTMMSLFVEEMSANILQHAERYQLGSVCIDFRLFVDKNKICFCLQDLSDAFDPTEYYRLYNDADREKHIGIRMVISMADEVRYFRTYKSNNLVVNIVTGTEDNQSVLMHN